MSKINTIVLIQEWGAGDIIFCQSIANHFVKQGYKVLWPVKDIYAPLAKHFPNITMVDKNLVNIDSTRNDEYEYNGCKVIPLRFTDSLCKVHYTDCMKSKYQYFGMDWINWKDDCNIQRDVKNEMKLFEEVLGLEFGEKYNLISEQFSTGGARKTEIQSPDNGLKNIYMRFLEGFTIIDWLYTMQQAANLYMIASSNIYLTELFHMKAETINLYIRRPIEQNHNNYSYILSKDKYILHP